MASEADKIADKYQRSMTRFNVDVDREMNDELNVIFPYGSKGRGVTQLLICVLEYVENHPDGKDGIISLLSGKLKLVKKDN